ncbi:probable arylsulfatase A [Rhodopirellula baltica SH 1]|uniref:Probable arylsulfatase A n=2 Tax=Rhodopirellula baltica TaxID=265606 RepID=Q7UTD0_RHOBA|nr:probable arylsulfatase A [Rhodopirellula baltica SH 1]
MSMRKPPVSFLKAFCVLVCLIGQASAEENPSVHGVSDGRPNIVWIIADDLGPELACYGYPDVATPNVDRLAERGRLFLNTFSTSPVCSSSRSAFQTGRYQTSIGCYHHLTRDKKELQVRTAIDWLREAGYFISHGNGEVGNKQANKYGVNYLYDKRTHFDAYDWADRDPGQPFFAQVHIHEPHRPFVKSDRQRTEAPIPPYYPEHPITRADWSNYLATIEVMDQKVGGVLDRLESEGISENTLVIFFGDHGRPHVRGKQWLYEGGLHTPLIVRWPAKLAEASQESGMATLLDLVPTTLQAAGIEPPELPGKSLLKNQWAGHEYIFAARDRCGDAPDRIRSVRNERYKYIRNFHPEKPYLQLSSYKKLSYPVETLMKVLHEEGQWDSPFMAENRPEEELYDLSNDPHELHNLAKEGSYQSTLVQLRTTMDDWMNETGDQGGVDESQTVNMDELMAEKRKWYERTMQRRGLEPSVSDSEYLQWWATELGVE